MKRSILTEKIARRGLHLTREYSVDPFQMMRVRDVMVAEVDTLPAHLSIDRAVAFFTGPQVRHKSYPVVDARGVVLGLAPRAEVMRWLTEGPHEGQTLGDVVSDAGLLRGAPDEAVGKLVEQMVERDVGRVPIVDETRPAGRSRHPQGPAAGPCPSAGTRDRALSDAAGMAAQRGARKLTARP